MLVRHSKNSVYTKHVAYSVNHKLEHDGVVSERKECSSAKALSDPCLLGSPLICMLQRTIANSQFMMADGDKIMTINV